MEIEVMSKMTLKKYLEKNNVKLNDKIERQIIYNGIPLDYTVDIYGNVYSYKGINTTKPRKLKYIHDSHKPPYCVVNLSIPDNKEKMFYVHRLIALAFIPNDDPVNKYEVNHINGNKDDNSVNNLEWSTPKENIVHAFEHNLCFGRKGIAHHNAKMNEKQVNQIIKLIKLGRYSLADIADIIGNGCTVTIVNKIKKGEKWLHMTGGKIDAYTPHHRSKYSIEEIIEKDRDVRDILNMK